MAEAAPIDFRTSPDRYRHWKLSTEAGVAYLTMDVARRWRPEARLQAQAQLLRSRRRHRTRTTSSSASASSIRRSAPSSSRARRTALLFGRQHRHAGAVEPRRKVNFCKFTNETRNGIEDASRFGPKLHRRDQRHDGGRRLRAGAGLRRDHSRRRRSSAVSLPEVPLLGVLPGTGGLTRLSDKRRVRRDHADIFCTTPEA